MATSKASQPIHWFNYDSYRLNSFISWTPQNIEEITNLCDSGFYYYGVHRKVCCTGCGDVVTIEDDSRNIREIHQTSHPECQLFRFNMGDSSLLLPLPSVISITQILRQQGLSFNYKARLYTFEEMKQSMKKNIPEDGYLKQLAQIGIVYWTSERSIPWLKCVHCNMVIELKDIGKAIDLHKEASSHCVRVYDEVDADIVNQFLSFN
jgi:hypothetical protein